MNDMVNNNNYLKRKVKLFEKKGVLPVIGCDA